eukprot:GEMP01068240.1.p1 GENE.GEMP01068240.1~~GEMP01068240.1.p1  ORF type:complete len:359 (+),score=53.63 GEMP01068240.1:29-1078(+)
MRIRGIALYLGTAMVGAAGDDGTLDAFLASKGCRFLEPEKDMTFNVGSEEVKLDFLSLDEAKMSCSMTPICVGIVCRSPDGMVKCQDIMVEGYDTDSINVNEIIAPEAGTTLYRRICDLPMDESSTQIDQIFAGEPEQEDGDADKGEDVAKEANLSNLEAVLADFWASETLTFNVEARSQEILYEDVVAPIKHKSISVVFFASDRSEGALETISLSIFGPDDKEIHSTGKKYEGALKVRVHKPGTYKIVLENSHLATGAWVTIMFGGDKLKPEHLEHMNEELSVVEKLLQSISQGDTYLWQRQSTALHVISAMNLNCLALRTFEFLVMSFMAALQLIYVRSLCSHRRVI